MADIIDIRRAKRHRTVQLRDSGRPWDQSERQKPERGQKKSRAERQAPRLLPFCTQVKIGDYFTVIVGKEIAAELAPNSAGQRVIEFPEEGPHEFKVSHYSLSQSPLDRLRAREGDLLLRMMRPEKKFVIEDVATLEKRAMEHILAGELVPLSILAGAKAEALAEEARTLKRLPPELKKLLEDKAQANREKARLKASWRVAHPMQEVDADLNGCFIGRNVVALRPKNASVPAVAILQFFYFDGMPWDFLTDWLARATSANSKSEMVHVLRELSVPLLPAEVDDVFREMSELKERERDMDLDLFDDDFRYVLDARDRNDFDRRMLRLRAEQYTLRQALSESRSLPYLIKNFYPFPIAFPHHSLGAFTHARDVLDEQLRVAENILAFVASLALALSRPPSNDLVKEFETHRNFSPGDWLAIGRKATKVLATAAHDDLPNGLRLLFGGIFAQQADQLVQLRNDRHHRGIDSANITNKALAKLLEACLDELAFLARFPLFRVCGVEIDRHSGKAIHRIEKYTRTDPVYEQDLLTSDKPLATGLSVQTDTGPVDLFPFITTRECPGYHQLQTYFLDRAPKNGKGWQLKSFERGHSLEANDVAEGLSTWRGEGHRL
jgi:hypothetical protein